MNVMFLELETGLDEEQSKQHEYSSQVLMLPLTAAPISLPQLTPTTKWEIQLMEEEAFDSWIETNRLVCGFKAKNGRLLHYSFTWKYSGDWQFFKRSEFWVVWKFALWGERSNLEYIWNHGPFYMTWLLIRILKRVIKRLGMRKSGRYRCTDLWVWS